MERGMFGILLLSGLCHFASSLYQHSYQFINKLKTWPEARQYCREKHKDLATVNDEQDLEVLAGLVESEASNIFLGLYRNWSWSFPNSDERNDEELVYWNWASGEPSENGPYCGSIGETGEWFAINCSNSLNFICYNGSNTDLSERFILGEGSMNWVTAQAHCRGQHTELATVQNQFENKALRRMVNESRVWIGLKRKSWVWSGASQPSFKPWRPQQPLSDGVSNCAALEVKNLPIGLIGMDCQGKLPFFCNTDPMRKHLVKLKLTAADSSVDMADPAVMESILKWVQRKLSGEGASEDVKLSWRKPPEKEENSKQEETETLEEMCRP